MRLALDRSGKLAAPVQVMTTGSPTCILFAPAPGSHFFQENLMRLLVLPGDGIGPEISAATLAVLNAAAAATGVTFEISTKWTSA